MKDLAIMTYVNGIKLYLDNNWPIGFGMQTFSLVIELIITNSNPVAKLHLGWEIRKIFYL